MAEVIFTNELTQESILRYGTLDKDQIYNGLDCMVTLEVLGELTRLNNQCPIVYDFERALQAPALEMMLRGFAVDQYERQKRIGELRGVVLRLQARLNRMARAVWDRPVDKAGNTLNPNSPKQLQEFFYSAMRLPEHWSSKQGKRSLSMDRESLEKLSQHFYALPLCNCILAIREASKALKTLETEIDSDGRMRTSYNIAATTTGRWSSSKNAFGTGGNLQNWKERLRAVFVADRGWKLVSIDLEQADAREIGFAIGVLFGDWTYLDACESGDLHTGTARLVWPELSWPGNPKGDRELADGNFYRDFSYRDMSKRGGHGTTYVGTPWTMSRHLKVPIKVMEVFQERFFAAYPGIPRLHLWVAQELQTQRKLTTYWGRERHFFGRPDDDATLREAVAHLGQSPTADRMSLGIYRMWQTMRKSIRLTAQLHDAVYFQIPDDAKAEQELVAQALACCQIPITAPSGRVFVVSGEAKVGWNWSRKHDEGKALDAKKNPFNPNGLIKWKPGVPDRRKRVEGLETTL